MRNLIWAAVLGCVVLASCGGGGGSGDGTGGSAGSGSGSGGGDIYVSLVYPNTGVSLYQQAAIQPQLGGFEGHQARCSLVSGQPPQGVSLGTDCALTGRPMQAGTFVFMVRVGASGAANTIDVSASLTVNGPRVTYPDRSFLQALSAGDTVDDAPSVSIWTPAPDLSPSWTYRIASGTLPTGLSLDPASGHITGTVTAAGAFNAAIQATMATQFGSYEPTVSTYSVNVNVPMVTYGSTFASAVAYVSQPVSVAPSLVGHAAAGTTIGNVVFRQPLPGGLSVDAAGVVSGIPDGTGIPTSPLDLDATLTTAGGTAATQGMMFMQVDYPVSYTYANGAQLSATQASVFSVTPTLVQLSPDALLPTATVTFAQDPTWCSMPPGLALDPATGAVSGTPTAPGSFNCTVNATITNNGVTWTGVSQLAIVVQ